MDILNSNSINRANSIIDSIGSDCAVKKIKKDAGLMERSNIEQKIILEEDNRQVIFG